MKKIFCICSLILLYKISFSQIDFIRDTTFNPPKCIGIGNDMLLLVDSSLLVHHSGTSIPCTHNYHYDRMAKLNPNDGSYDSNYRASPFIPNQSTIKLYEYDGYIYHYNSYTFSRFTMNGDLDVDWPPNDFSFYGGIAGIKFVPEINRFFLVGFFYKDKFEFDHSIEKGVSCLWFDLDGNRDTTFSAPIFHLTQDIQDTSQHRNGIFKWIYSEISNYAYVTPVPQYANGHYSKSFFRIFPDGQVDTTFRFTQGGQLDSIAGFSDFFEQTDGKLILTGSFYIRDAEKVIFTTMIRLNQDGSFDSTFNYKNNTLPEDFDIERDVELIHQNRVKCLTYWKDDLYFIGGNFVNYQGQYKGKIAVIDKNGFLVDDYFQGTGFIESDGGGHLRIASINKVIVTSPDTILVCGRYIAYNDELYRPGIMKLVLESTTSTSESVEPLNINVYPNPTTGMVTLETDRYLEGTNSTLHPTVTISDQLGRVLKQDKWSTGQRFDIDISHLNEGVYFIRLHEGNQLIWTDRLVKVSGR